MATRNSNQTNRSITTALLRKYIEDLVPAMRAMITLLNTSAQELRSPHASAQIAVADTLQRCCSERLREQICAAEGLLSGTVATRSRPHGEAAVAA